MSERMTLKKFDSLKPRDFENGAILDEIRFTVKLCEELYLKWLLHGDGMAQDQLVRLNGTDDPEPVDPWEEWIRQFPQVLDQQAIEMVQDWLRTCPRRRYEAIPHPPTLP